MEILYGLKNGALIQRDKDGFCRCIFKAKTEGVLKTTLGNIINNGNGEYILGGIPAGGPYELELYDGSDRKKLSIWVGDLWILAGQSNMEGSGCVNDKIDEETENTTDCIRCYYFDTHWGKAEPVTHKPWLSPDECIGGRWKKEHRESKWGTDKPCVFNGKEVRNRAVGPGYFFAKRMYEISGIPQAVIPCALGGTSLNEWEKGYNGENGLYSVMIRRFKETGGNVRGIFWDQGESECYEGNDFTGKMIKFISNVRTDVNVPELPFVQVQISKSAVYEHCNDPKNGIEWSRIKEEQRMLDKKIPFLITISAADADFDDLIHYSSEFQEKMGIRAANAMAELIGEGGVAVPVPCNITYRTNDEYMPFCYIYEIQYKNIKYLTANGVPSGFAVIGKDRELKNIFNPGIGVQKITLNGNTVTLYTEITEDPEEVLICYGFGHMAYCNITTDTLYSIPAMGPIKVKELKKQCEN